MPAASVGGQSEHPGWEGNTAETAHALTNVTAPLSSISSQCQMRCSQRKVGLPAALLVCTGGVKCTVPRLPSCIAGRGCLVVACGSSQLHATTRFLAGNTTACPLPLQVHGADICCLAFSASSKLLAAADRTGVVSLTDISKPIVRWLQLATSQPIVSIALATAALPGPRDRCAARSPRRCAAGDVPHDCPPFQHGWCQVASLRESGTCSLRTQVPGIQLRDSRWTQEQCPCLVSCCAAAHRIMPVLHSACRREGKQGIAAPATPPTAWHHPSLAARGRDAVAGAVLAGRACLLLV
jgi:hypothetical protein